MKLSTPMTLLRRNMFDNTNNDLLIWKALDEQSTGNCQRTVLRFEVKVDFAYVLAFHRIDKLKVRSSYGLLAYFSDIFISGQNMQADHNLNGL